MTVRDALQRELTDAMRRRDKPVVDALRSALGALANAEALPVTAPLDTTAGTADFAGATPGLAATEAPRVTLSEQQERQIVTDTAAEFSAHSQRLTRMCRHDEADGARRATDTLEAILRG